MANLNSIQMTPPVYPVSGPMNAGRGEQAATGNITFTRSADGTDVIRMTRLHRNFRVTGGYLKYTGTPTGVSAIVGDAADTDRYFTTQSIATAGSTVAMADTGRGFNNVGGTDVLVTLSGGSAGVTGTLELVIYGIIEQPL